MRDVSSLAEPKSGSDLPLQPRQRQRLPVPRRIAAWIAATATGESTALVFVVGFAILHALLWTVILTALKGAQDVHMDVAEAFAWGQKFQFGYGKHPPLAGWVAGLWFKLFPAVDWASYALAMATLGCGLAICWLIAIRVVDRRRAMFGVAMLALYPIFNFKGFKYNPDLLQLVTLPLAVLAYLHAFEKRTAWSGFCLGLAAAAAVMTKYWVLTMLGAIFLAALIHPQRMRFLRSPAPWVAIATFAVAMLPHLWWLVQVNFVPLTYAGDVYGSQGWAVTLQKVSLYAGHNLVLLLVPVVFAGLALILNRPWWKPLGIHGLIDATRRTWVRGKNPGVDLDQARNVWIIQSIVALGPMVPALLFGVYMKTDWGISLFFLTPLALVAIPALRLRQRALVALLTMWLAVTLFMLLAAPTIAARTTRADGPPGTTFGPNSEFAVQLTQAWRSRFGSRWAVVAGTTELGEHMTFYSPDHPAPLTPGEVWSSGLTSLAEAERLGFIGICDTGDNRLHDCEIWMGQHAANGERVDLESRRTFHGKAAGPIVKWKAWIVPPPRP